MKDFALWKRCRKEDDLANFVQTGSDLGSDLVMSAADFLVWLSFDFVLLFF